MHDTSMPLSHSSEPTDFSVVDVPLAQQPYRVIIGENLLPNAAGLFQQFATQSSLAAPHTLPHQAFLVVDANAQSHAQPLMEALTKAGCVVASITITAQETHKTLETLQQVLVAMAKARLERSDVVFALGGGITGDVAGFAAASYRRGVPVVQCPTTLLAMVDASVGGKTGVNLQVGSTLEKNMVGAFHQPSLVMADINTLATLDDRQFNAGLAECIKHSLLGNVSDHPMHQAHRTWLVDALDSIMHRTPAVLCELIERSVSFKAWIVSCDERELAGSTSNRPSRALLNLGHTFAHAIETIHTLSPDGNPDNAPLLHGEAVGLGLVAAAATGVKLGMCPEALPGDIASLLNACRLPGTVQGLPANAELLDRMGADKKVTGGQLRLIVPTGNNRACIVESPSPEAIDTGWNAIRA